MTYYLLYLSVSPLIDSVPPLSLVPPPQQPSNSLLSTTDTSRWSRGAANRDWTELRKKLHLTMPILSILYEDHDNKLPESQLEHCGRDLKTRHACGPKIDGIVRCKKSQREVDPIKIGKKNEESTGTKILKDSRKISKVMKDMFDLICSISTAVNEILLIKDCMKSMSRLAYDQICPGTEDLLLELSRPVRHAPLPVAPASTFTMRRPYQSAAEDIST
ncbi:hypothetical protein EDD21DRAFT_419295 [Dissophora ornata]|nr:hypothetical protein EDD21DRAFT_419295 [Dissophora ornata]